MSENEVWKDVVGYEGFYKVSNKGNVYSVERLNSRGYKCGGRILRSRYTGNGYLQVGLYKNGKMKGKYIHRLVVEAFIPNQNNYLEINHKDEIKTNNELPNLEWCTREHNINHGTRIERIVEKTSKKVKAVNVETGEVVTFNSTQEAERKGYNSGNVAAACKGVYKNGGGKLIGGGNLYRGHRWSYMERGE